MVGMCDARVGCDGGGPGGGSKGVIPAFCVLGTAGAAGVCGREDGGGGIVNADKGLELACATLRGLGFDEAGEFDLAAAPGYNWASGFADIGVGGRLLLDVAGVGKTFRYS